MMLFIDNDGVCFTFSASFFQVMVLSRDRQELVARGHPITSAREPGRLGQNFFRMLLWRRTRKPKINIVQKEGSEAMGWRTWWWPAFPISEIYLQLQNGQKLVEFSSGRLENWRTEKTCFLLLSICTLAQTENSACHFIVKFSLAAGIFWRI